MNLMFFAFRKLLLALIIVISLALSGCESDPILSPQVEVTEEAGGSYGNTNVSISTTEKTENTTKDQVNDTIRNNRRKITNPKRF